MAKISSFTARLDTEVDGTEFIVLADTDAVYNTVTASTISASTADDSFNDLANGLAGYKVGTTISVSGFATGSLNTTYTIATVASDGSKITVNETLTADESAGSSVTIDGLGVNYKMLLSELAQYVGAAGLPDPLTGITLEDSTAERVYGVPTDVTSSISGGALVFDYAVSDYQYATFTSAGIVLTTSNMPAGSTMKIVLFDADTYAPDISAFTPVLNGDTITFDAVTVIIAEALTSTTVRYINGGTYSS